MQTIKRNYGGGVEMFLSMLNNEEKKLFAELAVTLSSIDGDYSDIERIMVESYCKEMDIKYICSEMPNFEQIILRINCIANEKEKKIILFESIGLVLVDGIYDETEKHAISRMEKEFGISHHFTEECISMISEYLKFQEKLNKLILE